MLNYYLDGNYTPLIFFLSHEAYNTNFVSTFPNSYVNFFFFFIENSIKWNGIYLLT